MVGRPILQDPLALDDVSQPQPDIAVLKSRQDFSSTAQPGPADVLLVIEVADTSLAFDLGVKVPLYAAHHIPEVWVIDAATRRMHRFRRRVTQDRGGEQRPLTIGPASRPLYRRPGRARWRSRRRHQPDYKYATIPTLLCPSSEVKVSQNTAPAEDGATVHYFAVLGPKGQMPGSSPAANYTTMLASSHGDIAEQGMMGVNSKTSFGKVTDGLSNSFMCAEMSWKDCNCLRKWMRGVAGNSGQSTVVSAKNMNHSIGSTPYNGSNGLNDVSFGSQHTSGAVFGMGDGATLFLSDSISLDILKQLSSRNGGEKVRLPE